MTASRDALVEEALARIDGLMSHRRRAFCAQPALREVSLPQLHALMLLQEGGPMMVSELARLLAISTPSASSIVDRMEEHGLVRRVRDTVDRRVVCVEILERGHAMVSELMGLKRDQIKRLLDVMTDQELRDLTRGVEALCHAVSRNRREMSDGERHMVGPDDLVGTSVDGVER